MWAMLAPMHCMDGRQRFERQTDGSVIRSKLAASTTACSSINVDLICDDRSGHGVVTMILVVFLASQPSVRVVVIRSVEFIYSVIRGRATVQASQ